MSIKNVIIDGHGEELTSIPFSFERTATNASKLYSYVRQGVGIPINQSNRIIEEIKQGDFNKEIATINSSRIGGTLVTDKKLYAIGETEDGDPQWSNDALFSNGVMRKVRIGTVILREFTLGDSIYLRFKVGSEKSVKLSQIINHYSDGKYNFFWVVCRSE